MGFIDRTRYSPCDKKTGGLYSHLSMFGYTSRTVQSLVNESYDLRINPYSFRFEDAFLCPLFEAFNSFAKCRVIMPATESEMKMMNSGNTAKKTCSAIVPPVRKPQELSSIAAPRREYRVRIPSSGVQRVRTSNNFPSISPGCATHLGQAICLPSVPNSTCQVFCAIQPTAPPALLSSRRTGKSRQSRCCLQVSGYSASARYSSPALRRRRSGRSPSQRLDGERSVSSTQKGAAACIP